MGRLWKGFDGQHYKSAYDGISAARDDDYADMMMQGGVEYSSAWGPSYQRLYIQVGDLMNSFRFTL